MKNNIWVLSVISVFLSMILFSACSTTRYMVVKTEPADADLYVKGFDSEYFPKEKVKIGTTPFKMANIHLY